MKIIDISKQYGRLKIISQPYTKMCGKYKRWFVTVECICGKQNNVRLDLLERGKIRSCGCLANEIKKELGVRYGKLTVVSEPYRRIGFVGRAMYVDVICDCGVKKYVKCISLKSGITKSCGCLIAESNIKIHTIHGLSKHPLFRVWSNIIGRCYDVRSESYPNYGGNGVIMCAEWKNNFKPFYDWCMLNGWQKGLEVDKDIKGGKIYSPENCLIVTQKENARHKSTSKLKLEDAENIRLLYASGVYTYQKIADMYNVCINHISNIVNNKKWIN